MSLSQKHSGKVLVPWFNITEWKAVYNLIYTEYTQDWPKALEVLKIWKLRTPLLSAGVEGTLILLEALLVDTHRRSSYEITHIFSTSLVRFLNLCAANSDKQGTFYKTALKNGLPKWLISIRHDIAHSHNVPSRSMLELSLKFCLDWLKEKYWEMQDECMSDLIVDQVDDTSLEDAVHIYIHLSQSEGVLEDNRELMERINKFISSQGRSQLSAKKILEQVTIALKDIIKSNTQEAADKIFTLLVDNYFILLTDFEVDMFGDFLINVSFVTLLNISGKKKIPRSFISKWNNLLNILHETEIMPYFTYKLFDFVCDIRHDLLHQEVASLWIQEIFRGLINQKNNIENKEALHFTGRNSCMKDKNFVTEVLEKLTPFTLTFIQ
ncbi:uncharacterized protein BDFB_006249, partial [Asbolus verrucosus]